MRLIDAEHLINKAEQEKKDGLLEDDELETVYYELSDEPTVDAVPVRHGKWIPVDSYSAYGGDEVTWNAHGNPIAFHYCSECKNHAYANEFGEDILSNYCPNCGAKMDAERKEE